MVHVEDDQVVDFTLADEREAITPIGTGLRFLAGILALDRALAFPNNVAGQRVNLQQANLRAASCFAQRRAGVQVYAAVFFRFQRRRTHHALAQINGPDRLHRVHIHALEEACVVAIVT